MSNKLERNKIKREAFWKLLKEEFLKVFPPSGSTVKFKTSSLGYITEGYFTYEMVGHAGYYSYSSSDSDTGYMSVNLLFHVTDFTNANGESVDMGALGMKTFSAVEKKLSTQIKQWVFRTTDKVDIEKGKVIETLYKNIRADVTVKVPNNLKNFESHKDKGISAISKVLKQVDLSSDNLFGNGEVINFNVAKIEKGTNVDFILHLAHDAGEEPFSAYQLNNIFKQMNFQINSHLKTYIDREYTFVIIFDKINYKVV